MVLVINKKTSLKEFEKLFDKMLRSKKGIDTKKYCGVLSLKEDPLELQKKWRNEWQ